MQFHKSIVLVTLKKPFPSIDVLRKYESLKVPGFYLGTADPAFQESFCPGGEGREQGNQEAVKRRLPLQSEDNRCSSSSEGLTGAPQAHGRLA